MSVIQVNLDEVVRTGDNFTRMYGEVDGLVRSANTQMVNLQDQFKGARATKIMGQWEEMRPRLEAATRTLQSAGQLLSNAARDFEAVDMR
ncbi:MAG: WXG100 family type VII secretion target [Anaerolineales bacterium]